MAALAENRKVNTLNFNDIFGGIIVKMDVIASDIIYKGAVVKLGTNGVAPCAGTDGAAAIGIAMEKADNASGAAGDVQVDVLIGGYVVVGAITGLTDESQIGEAVYISTDNIADLTNVVTNEFFGTVVGYTGAGGNEFIVKMRGDIGPAVEAYTVTNDLADRVFDANTVAVAELADVVGTLIRDLADRGIINAI